MAWTQTQIDTLEAAIAGGSVLSSVTIDGQTFSFRSLAEMREQLAIMKRQAAGDSGTRYAATSKGA